MFVSCIGSLNSGRKLFGISNKNQLFTLKPEKQNSKLAQATGQARVDIYGTIFFLRFKNYLKAEGKGGRKKGKHQCVVTFCVPSTGDLAHNPGMCPDWESNQ